MTNHSRQQATRTRRRRTPVAALVTLTLALTLWGNGAGAGIIHAGQTEQIAINFGNARPFASVGQVVSIEQGGGGLAGSGVYLGDRWMITAAHVVDSAADVRFSLGGVTAFGITAYIHPVWDANNILAGNDLALVRLDRDFPTVTPATRLEGRGDAGRFSAMVGYGHTGTPTGGFDTSTALIKRGGRNNIDAVLSNRILLADFDSGSDADNIIGTPRVDRLEYLIAPGDSGGGAFVYKDQQWVLAGIHSFGAATVDGLANSDYGDLSGHSRILYHNRWIDRVLDTADTLPNAIGATLATNLSGGTAFGAVTQLPEPALLLAALAVTFGGRPGRRRRFLHDPR